MIFTITEIPAIVLCQPKIFGDEPGYFVETFRQDLFDDFIGYKVNFIQDNESKSSYGVLRGLHYQIPPYTQAKLVRVIQGKVLDVAVDIRQNSPTVGKYVAVELCSDKKNQLFIPQGFAYGFIVLSKECIFTYKVDNLYAPNLERGIHFEDKTLGINWGLPRDKILYSAKDLEWPTLMKISQI